MSDVAHGPLVYLHIGFGFHDVFDLTLSNFFNSDPFLPEAMKYALDKMQSVHVFSEEDYHPFFQKGLHIQYVYKLNAYVMKQWFWKDGEGKWNPYSIETNARINKYHQRDPKSTVVVSVNNMR